MQRADAEVQAAVGVQGGLGIMAGSVESEMQIHQHTWRATCMSTHTDTHAYIQSTNTHTGTPIHPHTRHTCVHKDTHKYAHGHTHPPTHPHSYTHTHTQSNTIHPYTPICLKL